MLCRSCQKPSRVRYPSLDQLLIRQIDSTLLGDVLRRISMKEDGRKLSKEQQVESRRRAMFLLKRGWHERDIAEAVGVA